MWPTYWLPATCMLLSHTNLSERSGSQCKCKCQIPRQQICRQQKLKFLKLPAWLRLLPKWRCPQGRFQLEVPRIGVRFRLSWQMNNNNTLAVSEENYIDRNHNPSLAYIRQQQIKCTSTMYVHRKNGHHTIPVGSLYLPPKENGLVLVANSVGLISNALRNSIEDLTLKRHCPTLPME